MAPPSTTTSTAKRALPGSGSGAFGATRISPGYIPRVSSGKLMEAVRSVLNHLHVTASLPSRLPHGSSRQRPQFQTCRIITAIRSLQPSALQGHGCHASSSRRRCIRCSLRLCCTYWDLDLDGFHAQSKCCVEISTCLCVIDSACRSPWMHAVPWTSCFWRGESSVTFQATLRTASQLLPCTICQNAALIPLPII